jgi:group I intron endonuclease
MVNPNRFYTYAYLREDRTPYYIGKGSGKRIYQQNGKPCGVPKDKNKIIFLKQNLIEEDAFNHEKYIISVFGRIDIGTGVLRNKSDGGQGSSGAIRSEETKKKMSESLKGRIFTEKHRKNIGKSSEGRIFSKESRKKMSESHLGKFVGEKSPVYGKKHTEQTKRKLSELNAGNNNPFYGKKHTEELKQKLSSKHNKLLRFISPGGEVVEEWTTLRMFCKKYNLSRCELVKLMNGKQSQHKGWTIFNENKIYT